MNEFLWLTSTDAQVLLELLRGKASKRKLRLFSSACLRDLGRIPEAEIPGRFADGAATEADLIAAPHHQGATTEETWHEATRACGLPADALEERRRRCEWLHDLFGNPFQPQRLDAAWLRWNDGTVRKMARAIYDENRFVDLPILADTLEEAGCDELPLLYHCRNGEHWRGCWAVDLLLGMT